jgi:hypothetical protein
LKNRYQTTVLHLTACQVQKRQQHRKGLFRTIVLGPGLLALFFGLLEQRRKHDPVGSFKPP